MICTCRITVRTVKQIQNVWMDGHTTKRQGMLAEIWWGKVVEKRPPGSPKNGLEVKIKMDFMEICG